jgi:hypothetical protein
VEDCSPIFYRNAGKIESNPNYQTAQGKITINYWDSSWNAYWGGMGPRTVAEFVADCDWLTRPPSAGPPPGHDQADRNQKSIYSKAIDFLERLGKLSDRSLVARCNKETL